MLKNSRTERLNSLQNSFVEEFIKYNGKVIFEIATGVGNVLK